MRTLILCAALALLTACAGSKPLVQTSIERSLELRYVQLPTDWTADTDVPAKPAARCLWDESLAAWRAALEAWFDAGAVGAPPAKPKGAAPSNTLCQGDLARWCEDTRTALATCNIDKAAIRRAQPVGSPSWAK